METNVKKMAIALLSAATILVSCKKEPITPMDPIKKDVFNKAEPVQPPEKMMVPNGDVNPEDQIVMKKWKVTAFYPDGHMAKDDPFKDYIFEFNKYDVVLAKSPKGSFSGKWNYVTIKDKKVVIIDFGKNPFIVMNSHWKIKQLSSQYLDMYNDVDGTLAFTAVTDAKESDKEK